MHGLKFFLSEMPIGVREVSLSNSSIWTLDFRVQANFKENVHFLNFLNFTHREFSIFEFFSDGGTSAIPPTISPRYRRYSLIVINFRPMLLDEGFYREPSAFDWTMALFWASSFK